MGELEAVFDITDYLRESGIDSLEYLDNPDKANVHSYTKEIWKDILHYGLKDRLMEAAFPT